MNATSKDSVRNYLAEIGRIPLLTLEQEIILGKQVQKLSFLYSIKEKLKVALDREPTRKEWAEKANCSMFTLERDLDRGKKAKDRLVASNFRLVVAIAKLQQAYPDKNAISFQFFS
ncbi:MAG: sigma-70 factor domain-containing protein [Xenococcaceae cyanobacterium]